MTRHLMTRHLSARERSRTPAWQRTPDSVVGWGSSILADGASQAGFIGASSLELSAKVVRVEGFQDPVLGGHVSPAVHQPTQGAHDDQRPAHVPTHESSSRGAAPAPQNAPAP